MIDHNVFVAELLRLGAYLQREGARITREFGLTQQQFVVLKSVQEQGPVSQKKIVSALLYEKSNVSKAVSSLERKGLIATWKKETDLRVVLCEVTDEGCSVISKCMRSFAVWNKGWLSGVPQEDLQRVWTILHGLDRKE